MRKVLDLRAPTNIILHIVLSHFKSSQELSPYDVVFLSWLLGLFLDFLIQTQKLYLIKNISKLDLIL